MVRVGERVCTDFPCFIPRETLLINQDAHQLRNCNRWVRIVKLNRLLLRKIGKSRNLPLHGDVEYRELTLLSGSTAALNAESYLSHGYRSGRAL